MYFLDYSIDLQILTIYYSGIEDSIHLAIDSGITDIIITGDFNFNMLNDQTSREIDTFCEQFPCSSA